jgi:4-methyl-5(b-hydroxyethyl)-thiazole monophosphate biosynthesis
VLFLLLPSLLTTFVFIYFKACITDTLTRFGAEVTIASVMNGELVCKMSRGIKVIADTTIEDAAKEEWDLVALPGAF